MRFSQVKGQDALKAKVVSMIDNHHFPHAVLISGKDGYGSVAMALAIAQYIACENKTNGDSCGECPSCKGYQKLIHPDLHLYFPTTTTKKIDKDNSSSLFTDEFRNYVLEHEGYIDFNSWIDYMGGENKQGIINVRDADNIVMNATLKTFVSNYKIIFVWNADRLNIEASNKLLKILEEPYPNTVFILTAEHKEKIMPTIMSRVQTIFLSPLSDETIAMELRKRDPELTPEQIKYQAMLCEGDLNRLSEEFFRKENECREMFVQINRLAMTYKTKAIDISHFVDEKSKMTRSNLKEFFSYFISTVEKCWLYKCGIPMMQHPLETSEEIFKNNYPKFITQNNLEGIYNIAEKAYHNVDRNANAKINLFNFIIKLGTLLERR